MSYLLLIHEPRGQRETRNADEGAALYERMVEFGRGLTARGVLRASESLTTDGDTARVTRHDAGRTLIDGPFAEAKEMVGGFFLLQNVSRDEAIAIAAECPAAEWAAVEVRTLGPCFN